jgi:hypothetical protein
MSQHRMRLVRFLKFFNFLGQEFNFERSNGPLEMLHVYLQFATNYKMSTEVKLL